MIFAQGFGIETSSMPIEGNLCSWLQTNKKPFLSFDLKRDKRLRICKESIYAGYSMLVTPFVSKDRVLGFILLLNRSKKNAFNYSHLVLLSGVSGYISVALENLKYLQEESDLRRLSYTKSSIMV